MKIVKKLSICCLSIFLLICLVSCGNSRNNNQSGNNSVAENVSLENTTYNEVEFENSNATKIKQEDNLIYITGTIDAMTDSQKAVLNEDSTTHVVSLKFVFDTERVLKKFEIKGKNIKVYSDNESETNHVGKLTDLLDSEEGEDAFANLILSANTTNYELVSTYTDGTKSTIKINIAATLATATAE